MLFGASSCNQSHFTLAETLDLLPLAAQRAEELGFYSFWASDHILIPEDFGSPYPYHPSGRFLYQPDHVVLEPLTVLAACASITKRIRLGTSVLIAPLRHPVYAAKVLATLDCLSRGRLIVGVGTGWMKTEFDVLGAPSFEERGALTDEHIRIYKELWTSDTPAFAGRWYSFSGFKLSPRPLQAPHPPIWAGGHSKAALRRVARLCDGWHPVTLPVDEYTACIGQLRRLCHEQGRSFDELQLSMSATLVIDRNAKGREAEVADSESCSAHIEGIADQVARTLRRYQDAGLRHLKGYYHLKDVASGPDNVLRGMEVFMRDIAPQLS